MSPEWTNITPQFLLFGTAIMSWIELISHSTSARSWEAIKVLISCKYCSDLTPLYPGHPDCSLCMTRAADLGCVWCGTRCEYTKNCPVGQSNVCPQPRIDLVKPLSGPVDGGTTITIEGSNLAMGINQLKGRVMVGNNPCKVTNYQVSVKIECKTSGAFKVKECIKYTLKIQLLTRLMCKAIPQALALIVINKPLTLKCTKKISRPLPFLLAKSFQFHE